MTYPRIAGYIYEAEILCPDCVLPNLVGTQALNDVEMDLDHYAKVYGIDRYNEVTFDSDDFPKVVFAIALEHTEHCRRCGERL